MATKTYRIFRTFWLTVSILCDYGDGRVLVETLAYFYGVVARSELQDEARSNAL